MGKKITLQDIAKIAGVSSATVHKALNNSSGVSPAKRAEIQEIALSLNYIPASRNENVKKLLVVLFPAPLDTDQCFYQFIWKGIEKREDELFGSSLSFVNVTFDGTTSDQLRKLDQIYAVYGSSISALLTIIWNEDQYIDTLQKFLDMGTKIYTISTYAPKCGTCGTIMTNPYKVGRLAAEYLGTILDGFCRILLVGTRRDVLNHANVVRGFFDQMSSTDPRIQILEIYESKKYPEQLEQALEDMLTKFSDIKGIYADNARSTAQVINVLRKHRPSCEEERIFVIGSELFEQSVKALEDGIIDAIIDQDAVQLAYDAISMTFNDLMLGLSPEKITYLYCSLYLANNVPDIKYDEDEQKHTKLINNQFMIDAKKAGVDIS